MRTLGIVLAWGAGSAAAGAVVGLAVGLFTGRPLESAPLSISVLFGLVVGLSAMICSVFLFPRLQGLGPVARPILLGLALSSGAVVGTVAVLNLYPLFVFRDPRQTGAILAINGLLSLVVGGLAYSYERMGQRLQSALREMEEVRLVEARLREEAARAELAALQARINPHFFFNTLNTIASLLEEDPEAAEEVVHTLADLFRYTFRAASTRPVRFEEELEFVRAYLSIERARFGDRLRLEWDIDDAARGVTLPGLILQPLVENAVGHGVSATAGGGTVRVAARLEDDALIVDVADDGPGLPAGDSPIRDGHGLANVERRLSAFYRGAARLELGPGSGGAGTRVRLHLPRARPAVAATGAAGAETGAGTAARSEP